MVYLQHIDYSIQDCDIVVNLYRMPEITVNCIIERNDTGIFFNNIIKDITDNCNGELYVYAPAAFSRTELPSMHRCPADIFSRYSEIIQEEPSAAGYMHVTFRYKILLKLSQNAAMPEPDLLSAGVLKEFVISPLPEFIIESPFCKGTNAISPNSFTDIFMGCSVQGSKANTFLNLSANVFLNSLKLKITHYSDMMKWDMLMKRMLYTGAVTLNEASFASRNPDSVYKYIISQQTMHQAYRLFSYFTELDCRKADIMGSLLCVNDLLDMCCGGMHDDKFFPNVTAVKHASELFSRIPESLSIPTERSERKNFPMELRLIHTILKEHYSRYFNFLV